MDENMKRMTAELATERIFYHRSKEPASVTNEYTELCSCVGRLRETLTEEQADLLKKCESAHNNVMGRMIRYYYMAGFRDALSFLFGWVGLK